MTLLEIITLLVIVFDKHHVMLLVRVFILEHPWRV